MNPNISCVVVLALSACSTPRQEAEVQEPSPAAEPGTKPVVERPVVEPVVEASRTDLNKMTPPFPATLVVPESYAVKTKWSMGTDANGLNYRFTVATVEVDDRRDMLIEMPDAARFAQIEGYREDKRWKQVFAKDGPKGSWAHAHEFSKKCSFSTLIPKGPLACNQAFTPCSKVELMAEMCLSMSATSPGRVESHGPDVAFASLKDPEARKAVFALAKAFTENNHKELAKLWGPKGVRVYGKRVRQKEALKAMPKAKSARLYFRLPCVGQTSPGEPESDEEDAYLVRGQHGDRLDAEDCGWHAHDSEQGGLDIYPIDTTDMMPVLRMSKDKVGQWKLSSVSYGNADDYNPNAP